MPGRTDRRSYYLVARGNNRNNGASLGPLYLNANNGLSNSNGNNWRSRLSYPRATNFRNSTTVARRRNPSTSLALKPPLRADGNARRKGVRPR